MLLGVKRAAYKLFETKDKANAPSPLGHGQAAMKIVKVLVTQCLTLYDPMDCSPPGSSVHGILPARILEWVAIPFSRDPPDPEGIWVSCIAGRLFTI